MQEIKLIKKKNNSYFLIKKNIVKLANIHQATNISPNRLVSIFLSNITKEDLLLPKKTKDEYWDWKLADKTSYKYFKKELSTYLKLSLNDLSFIVMQDHFKSNYLSKEYLGKNYESLVKNYYIQEQVLKELARESFIAKNPITPDMTPKQIAIRNQELGKISVKHWIGDITNYDYFSCAPKFMIDKVQLTLQHIDLYIINLLNNQYLDQDFIRLSTNQRLEVKLAPKQIQKTKVVKI